MKKDTSAEHLIEHERDPASCQPHPKAYPKQICKQNADAPAGNHGDDHRKEHIPRSPERIVLDMVECSRFPQKYDKKESRPSPDDLLTLRKQMHQWSMAEKDQNRKHDI